jgi:polyferredoxin
MSADELRGFIEGPYNRLCDRQMYLFFAHASDVALGVIAALAALSVLFKNFACRYLCPYGALLGLASLLSPAAVRRTGASCTQCGACSSACACGIDVQRSTTVRSPECTACLECVRACPKPEALRFGGARGSRISPLLYAGLLCAAFALVPQLFRALGYWASDTPAAYYRAGGPQAEASPR